MSEITSFIITLGILFLISTPALVWLYRWLQLGHHAAKNGQSFSSLKCASCDKGCGKKPVVESHCPVTENLLTKFPVEEPKE